MNKLKILLFYSISVVGSAHGMELVNESLLPTVVSEEYFVLFRGAHFGIGMDARLRASLNDESPQAGDSRYVTLSNDGNDPTQSRLLQLRKLQKLRTSGPYTSKAQSKSSKNALPYPSAYHWVLELYVNKYAAFKEQLLKPQSELSKLLRSYQLSFNDIFFVSTSLNCLTAVKYALGLCSGEYRSWPEWKPEAVNVNATLGYLDIFIIPRKDLRALGAFPVVEEFTLNTINLPYSFKQKDYTVAEEYVFPLSIPSKYHRKRVPLIVHKTHKARKPDFLDRFMRREAKDITTSISAQVEEMQSLVKGKRAFLYLLQNRLEADTDKLLSSEAVTLNKKGLPLIIKTYEEVKSSGRSSQGVLTLPSSIAIERVIDSFGHDEFTFQFEGLTQSTMHHIAALVRHQNLSRVIIGTKRDSETVGEHCLGMGCFRYDEPPELDCVIQAAAGRTKPLLFVVAFIIEPEFKGYLDDLSLRSKHMIKFEYDRQNYDAQEFECLEAEALHDVDEQVRAALFPTCYSVERIITTFVERVEELVDEFSETLYACEGFAYHDLHCNLDLDELRYDDNYNIPILAHEGVCFIEKYENLVTNFDDDYIFAEVYSYLDDESDEEDADQDKDSNSLESMDTDEGESRSKLLKDRFSYCYDAAKCKFERELHALISESLQELDEVVEYDSGEEEESSSGNGLSFSAVTAKRKAGRGVGSLQAEYLEGGVILKKRA